MKKQILSLVVASLALSSAVNADISYTDLHAGVMQATVANASNVGYTVGYGYATSWKNGIYFGTSLDYDIVDVNKQSTSSFGGNIKLGYEVLNHLALYGMVAATYQSLDKSTGGGFGYGAGVDYVISDSFAIGAEYLTYSISPEYVQALAYDYSKASVMLKYLF